MRLVCFRASLAESRTRATSDSLCRCQGGRQGKASSPPAALFNRLLVMNQESIVRYSVECRVQSLESMGPSTNNCLGCLAQDCCTAWSNSVVCTKRLVTGAPSAMSFCQSLSHSTPRKKRNNSHHTIVKDHFKDQQDQDQDIIRSDPSWLPDQRPADSMRFQKLELKRRLLSLPRRYAMLQLIDIQIFAITIVLQLLAGSCWWLILIADSC